MEGRESSNNRFSAAAGIVSLINKVREMSRKPRIDTDLSQVLEDFLQKLRECDVYLSNGIFNTNFAEAALLLQSSADLYGKKVDMLWDIIIDYQKRIVLYDEKGSGTSEEIEKVEERRRKYKRKRKVNSDEKETKKLISNLSFGPVGDCDYVNQCCEPNDLLSQWTNNSTPPSNSTNHGRVYCNSTSLFLPDDVLHTLDDNDYVGRYNQFHSASLVEEMFSLEDNNLLVDHQNCLTKMRIDCHVVHDFLHERGIPSDCASEKYVDDLKEYVTKFIENRKLDAKRDYGLFQQVCERQSYVNLHRLPIDIVQDKLRRISTAESMRISTADSMFDSAFDDSVGDDVANDDINTVETCHTTADSEVALEVPASSPQVLSEMTCGLGRGLEKRNKSCSQDSAFYDEDDMDAILSRGPTPVTPLVDDQICAGGSVVITGRLKRTSLMTPKVKEKRLPEEQPPRKIRISHKMLSKLSTGVTTSLISFENFYYNQYKSADGEGQPLPPDFSEWDSSDDESDFLGFDDPTCSELPLDELPLSDVENDASDDAPEITQVAENVRQSQIEESENMEERLQCQPELSDADLERQEVSRQNVREWRSFILPKLKALEKRSDFDIHEYGSKLIERTKIGETRNFSELVGGRSSGEVARCFIATLQMANTYNVEISGAIPGQLSNNSFKLKVLDKTRHHELLEEYQAPSEETFRERLEHVKSMNPNIVMHSTPSGPPPMKKLKKGIVSRKNLFSSC